MHLEQFKPKQLSLSYVFKILFILNHAWVKCQKLYFVQKGNLLLRDQSIPVLIQHFPYV